MMERLIEIGRCCGMEINVDETKTLRISRSPSPIPVIPPGQITMLRIPSARRTDKRNCKMI